MTQTPPDTTLSWPKLRREEVGLVVTSSRNTGSYAGEVPAGEELVIVKSYRGLTLLGRPCASCGLMILVKNINRGDLTIQRSLREDARFSPPASSIRWSWVMAAGLAWNSWGHPSEASQDDEVERPWVPQWEWVGMVCHTTSDMTNENGILPRRSEVVCFGSYQGLSIAARCCKSCGSSFNITKVHPEDLVTHRRGFPDDHVAVHRSGSSAGIHRKTARDLAWPGDVGVKQRPTLC